MDLGSLIGIAASGIESVDRALGVVGQNVANAGTAQWTRETAASTSATASGVGLGVRTLPAGREIDTALQAGVFAQNAVLAGLQTRQAALSTIDSAQGRIGEGDDLSGLVGKVGDAFTALLNDPANQTQQQAVVNAAGDLANRIGTLSVAIGQARQAAQDNAVQNVTDLNSSLADVGELGRQIIGLRAGGQSTADLENQRDAVLARIGQILPVRGLAQPNGDMRLVTPNGLVLPTDGDAKLALPSAGVGPSATYPANAAVPGVTLDGVDVTARLGQDGELGANISLRDQTLPSYQASLDEFARTLASRFQDQGLTLFSDSSGTVPAGGTPFAQSGYVGFASSIVVNPAVAQSPSLVRDGTHAVPGAAQGAAAFSPNPAGGPAGFSDLITRVLDFALGTEQQTGVPQTSPARSGLGPAGDLSAGFSSPASLSGFASALVGKLAQDGGAATDGVNSARSVATSLQAKLTSSSGVSIDAEMSSMLQLQNAYAANAKVMTAVQTMWDALLATVR